jgi:hypothetical protein
MDRKRKKKVKPIGAADKINGNRTPDALRAALQEYDIETSAKSQASAIGTIYRAATMEQVINLRTCLSAVKALQNLHSLCIRVSVLANKKGINNDFYLSA